MKELKKYLHLRVIDVEKIVPHENSDYSRVEPILQNIKKMQIFTNPILVAKVKDDLYMQVDGMTRLFATKKLGLKSILAQIIDYNDHELVDVSTWCHLSPIDEPAFLSQIKKIKNLIIAKAGGRYLRRRYIKDEGLGYLCSIVFRNKNIYRISIGGTLPQKVKALVDIVAIYKNNIVRDILPDAANISDIDFLFSIHQKCHSIVIFPTFTRHQVINTAVHNNTLLPAGLTRFIIKGRCLDVNFPVKYLKSNNSEAEKNEILQQFLKNKEYRTYAEPTIYFEP